MATEAMPPKKRKKLDPTPQIVNGEIRVPDTIPQPILQDIQERFLKDNFQLTPESLYDFVKHDPSFVTRILTSPSYFHLHTLLPGLFDHALKVNDPELITTLFKQPTLSRRPFSYSESQLNAIGWRDLQRISERVTQLVPDREPTKAQLAFIRGVLSKNYFILQWSDIARWAGFYNQQTVMRAILERKNYNALRDMVPVLIRTNNLQGLELILNNAFVLESSSPSLCADGLFFAAAWNRVDMARLLIERVKRVKWTQEARQLTISAYWAQLLGHTEISSLILNELYPGKNHETLLTPASKSLTDHKYASWIFRMIHSFEDLPPAALETLLEVTQQSQNAMRVFFVRSQIEWLTLEKTFKETQVAPMDTNPLLKSLERKDVQIIQSVLLGTQEMPAQECLRWIKEAIKLGDEQGALVLLDKYQSLQSLRMLETILKKAISADMGLVVDATIALVQKKSTRPLSLTRVLEKGLDMALDTNQYNSLKVILFGRAHTSIDSQLSLFWFESELLPDEPDPLVILLLSKAQTLLSEPQLFGLIRDIIQKQPGKVKALLSQEFLWKSLPRAEQEWCLLTVARTGDAELVNQVFSAERLKSLSIEGLKSVIESNRENGNLMAVLRHAVLPHSFAGRELLESLEREGVVLPHILQVIHP